METLARGSGFPLSALTAGGGMNGWRSMYEWVLASTVEGNPQCNTAIITACWNAGSRLCPSPSPRTLISLKSPEPLQRQLATTNRTANTDFSPPLDLWKSYIPQWKLPKETTKTQKDKISQLYLIGFDALMVLQQCHGDTRPRSHIQISFDLFVFYMFI